MNVFLILAAGRGNFGWMLFGMAFAGIALYVYFSVQLGLEEKRTAAALEALRKERETVAHLETKVDPIHWLDKSDVAVRAATKKRIYDAYPNLNKPTEIIRISDMDDNEGEAFGYERPGSDEVADPR